MESNRKQTKRKGLTSLIALLLCAALLIASTYAWFTDTATVKGNKINAGNLYVDIVATKERIQNAFATEAGYKDYNELESDTEATDLKNEIDEKVDDLTPDDGKIERGDKEYWIVTGKELPLITLQNVEPGQTWPVSVDVKNSGDLAISFTAGFSLDLEDPDDPASVKSYTGLETLENKQASSNPLTPKEYGFRKEKLEAMQMDGTTDIGKTLEDVLEVYSMTDVQYNASYKEGTGEQMKASMTLSKEGDDANYIGTIAQVMTCNDAAAMKKIEDDIENATNDEEKTELQAKYNDLKAVSARLAAASNGYCLTEAQIKEATGGSATSVPTIQLVDRLGNNIPNASGGVKTNVSDIGTAYFAIHMPEVVDNLYQNASIVLGVGATATQVEYEFDGTNVQIYDNKEARTPAPTTTPTTTP